MRYAFVAAGLAAVAYASKAETVDTTVTYCDPTKTDCAYWGDWAHKTTTTDDGSKTTSTGCSTTSTSTKCATWTVAGKASSTCKDVVVTASAKCDEEDPNKTWSDWESTTSATTTGCSTTKTETETSTKCATWTVSDKVTSKCFPTTVTVTKTDAAACDPTTSHWEDWETTTTSSSTGCGSTTKTETETSTKCATWTVSDKVTSKCFPTTVTVTKTEAEKCDPTTSHWEDWESTTTDCGVTTGTSTGTKCATWTVSDKVSSKCFATTVTTTGKPASCTSTTTTDDGENKTWGDWEDVDGCGATTKTSTSCTTFTPVADKTVTKCSTTTITTKPASCTSSSTTTDDGDNKTWADYTNGGNNGYTNGGNKDGETTVDPNGNGASQTWSDWQSGVISPVTLTSTAACSSYTGTGAPEWFKNLPTDVASSLAAKWTGGAPADWCYYTYSTNGANGGKPTGATTVDGEGASKTGSWAKYTGAANANTGSVALAGLAALAAAIIA